MKVQYRNTLLRIVTPQQATDFHYIDYIDDNGLLKIREDKYNDIINNITYYKALSETDNEIIALYHNVALRSIYIRTRTTYGSYTVEEEKEYIKNTDLDQFELSDVTMKYLYDSVGREIASQYIDSSLPQTDLMSRSVNKIYYLGTEEEYHNGDVPYLSTHYEGYNAEFERMWYDPKLLDDEVDDGQDIEQFLLQEAATFMNELQIPQDMQDWYFNDVFLPPL